MSNDPFPTDRYMMATVAHHKLGDISRDKPALAVIYGETDTDWIGQWAAGFGLVNVRFPKATTRELTEAEKAHYRTKVVQINGGAVEEIRIDKEVAR
ncbi:hypothetical protein [Dactylosporangium sp. CA-139066]|uniref:hypothetical protein n=1 Tax=Dactylosporangium sp. CA-139066 TaxID=3239930 RepID=UPI003D8B4DA2